MYKDKTFLAIIPARGGSKGLPRKNIKPLLGKPLVAWTIEQAFKSKYLDEIIVNTDDEEIAEISKKYGAKIPFIRPKELALDNTPTFDVIEHTIKFYKENLKKEFDYVVLLEPTSPLRKDNDIDNAIKKLIDNDKYDSLVSLGKVYLEHPSIVKQIKGDYIVPYIDENKNIKRRQDLEDVYFPYGVIYISKVDELLHYKTFYQPKTGYYLIERWQCYEVDDIYDFICIEAILKNRREGIIKWDFWL